jgi:hypothetical protein
MRLLIRQNGLAFVGTLILALAIAGQFVTDSKASAIDIDNPLRVQSRTEVDICVGTVGPTKESAKLATNAIKDALDHLAQTDPVYQAIYGSYNRAVATGCPSSPMLYDNHQKHPDKNPDFPWQKAVTKRPSRFLLYVWVVPEDSRKKAFEDLQHRTVAQEMTCQSDHVCSPVSWAVYVTPEDLGEKSSLSTWLAQGLGTASTVPDQPSNRHPKP